MACIWDASVENKHINTLGLHGKHAGSRNGL